MKELSIEEKAKRYDEAIEIAKDINNEQRAQPFNVMTRVFPELKESEDEIMVKFIKNQLFNIKKTITENYELDAKLTKAIAWLEKQCEQKPADKVEPKFKVGDWVVFNNKHQSIYQVEKIEDGYYILRHTHGGTFRVCVLHDESLRLWTIQDAKVGDVLVVENIIFIYRRILASHIVSYCKLINNIFEPFEDARTCCEGNSYVHPATKEQRDLLFQKIKEAGYIFDFNKKELKKIEDEIEIPYGAKDSELQEASYYIPEGFHAEIEGNKVVIKRGEQTPTEKPVWYDNMDDLIADRMIDEIQKSDLPEGSKHNRIYWINKHRVLPNQEWSEEDKKMLNDILMCGEHHCYLDAGNIAWLKSLKNRVLLQPKQEGSKEDENNILFLTSIIEEYFKDKEKITLCGNTVCANFTKEDVIDRLKSLRPQNWTEEDKERYISCLQRLGTGNPEQPETINSKWFKEHVYPKATWKPSEKQIHYLQAIVNDANNAGSESCHIILKELLKQLKTLI